MSDQDYGKMKKADLLVLVAEQDQEAHDILVEGKATKAAIIEWLENQDETPNTMSATLLKYRKRYVPSVAYSGRKSLSNGDVVAQFLEYKEPKEVAHQVEALLGFAKGELVEKYASLNPGQQRMNCGNRLRAALKRGDITEEQLA